ncbi:TRAP transporter small permease subunit [Helicobacter turcicus]|uniref:TRAP transporter small permease subunit n=1 Tax=Helicobacter turcicus TaxID=2867412 RepID=A0ABS7JN88_9HELI|nr:TRAP transporter small permease subunit [Helicobacter turcicus]MBX7490874.1 TRAP transporter small permease subunit [Helicobacter turcicus]MBX7545728.1 TRAP transporter small permease subunit [Helicobacter turcicus]
MQSILSIASFLDKISLVSSRISMVILWVLTFLIFGLSIALNFSYVNSKLDDLSLYCFALLVLLVISRTLKEDKHVRVDLIYAHYAQKTKIIGWFFTNLLFILPFSLIMVKYGLDFTIQSYKMVEASQNGKIPYYFVFKSFVVLGFMLLSLQSVSEALKAFVKIKQKDFTIAQDIYTEESECIKANLVK